MADGLDQTMSLLSNLSDVQLFAKLIADEVVNHLGSTYLKIFGGILSAMASAIVYMYLTQKSERKTADESTKDANNKLFAVLVESGKLMETVRRGLDDSAKCERKTRRALENIVVIVRGCNGRDNRLDNNPLDAILVQNNEGEEENETE